LEAWNLTGEWGVQSAYAYDGSQALSATTNATYKHNSDSSAQTAVNLAGSQWPVLRSGTASSWAPGTILLEVSPTARPGRGSTAPTGSRTNWVEQQVDLSAWKAQSNLRIRFQAGHG
jgi:hypothetical protein